MQKETETLTVLARDVQVGDVIDFGGVPITIKTVSDLYEHNLTRFTTSTNNYLHLGNNVKIVVTRPNPDAGLVFPIAELLALRGGWSSLDSANSYAQEVYLAGAKEFLAVIRETHDITPKAEA